MKEWSRLGSNSQPLGLEPDSLTIRALTYFLTSKKYCLPLFFYENNGNKETTEDQQVHTHCLMF